MIRRLLALVAVSAAALFAFAGPAAAAPGYTPTAAAGTVSTSTPQAGGTFVFAGSGFAPGAVVSISIGGKDVANRAANASGAFSARLTAPSTPGTYVVAGTGTGANGGTRTVSATIQVLGSQAGAGLPRTGIELGSQLWIAGGLVALGALLISLTAVRRRRGTASAA